MADLSRLSLPRRSAAGSGIGVMLHLTLLALSLAAPGPGDKMGKKHGHEDMPHHHDFKNTAEWVERFEAPDRVTWQKPAEVIGALNVRRGDKVADIGAGTGYFALPLGRAVGDGGAVYAIDTEPGMVDYLNARAAREKAPMVKGVLGKVDDPQIPEPLDLILIVDTFHHFEGRATYLPKLRAKLKPTGRLAIVDWQKRPLPMGPPDDMKIDEPQVVSEMKAAGFELAERLPFLEYQYFLIFVPRK